MRTQTELNRGNGDSKSISTKAPEPPTEIPDVPPAGFGCIWILFVIFMVFTLLVGIKFMWEQLL